MGPPGDEGDRRGVVEPMSWLPTLWGAGGKRGCRGDTECDGGAVPSPGWGWWLLGLPSPA